MDRSELSKSAPSLSVFAPTSQLAAARTQIHQRARSKSPTPDGRATNRSESAIAGVQSEAHFVANAGSGIAINPGNDGLSVVHPQDPQEVERGSLVAGVISGLPSWMVSLSVHLALILILAISSLGIGTGNQRIDLEFADSPSHFDTMMTEIEFENVVIEDEQELLDTDNTESIELEEVLIPLDMMEVYTSENRVVESTQHGPLAELPGSSTTHTGNKGKSAEFFGTKSYGSRFVFVIDCSLSMKGSRWYRAVKELNTAIDGLGDEQEFLVLLYNTKTSVMLNTRTAIAELVPASLGNKDGCRSWLRKKRPKGGTFPASSMFIALSLNPDAIFLLSDGELQDNTRGLLQFWNTEQASSNGEYSKVPIHTISLGGLGEGQRMMKSIANENAGVFTWAH